MAVADVTTRDKSKLQPNVRTTTCDDEAVTLVACQVFAVFMRCLRYHQGHDTARENLVAAHEVDENMFKYLGPSQKE